MKNIILGILLFLTALTATSNKIPNNSEQLICNQMQIEKADKDIPWSNTYFKLEPYLLQQTYNNQEDPVINIKKNNINLSYIVLTKTGSLFLTNGKRCIGLNGHEYFVLQDEWEDEDASSGIGILVIEISNNNAKKIFRDNFDDEHYTPKKLLDKQKFLPINTTLFEKNGGLYMKIGSTYKSDIITLKKPTSMK